MHRVRSVAVMGPRWLSARTNDGNPRLYNPTDYVRIEIESALKRDIRVIPVLVDGASMPRQSDLPLHALARRNAVEIPTTALRPTAMTSPATSCWRLGLPSHQRQRSSSLAPRFRKRKPAQS